MNLRQICCFLTRFRGLRGKCQINHFFGVFNPCACHCWNFEQKSSTKTCFWNFERKRNFFFWLWGVWWGVFRNFVPNLKNQCFFRSDFGFGKFIQLCVFWSPTSPQQATETSFSRFWVWGVFFLNFQLWAPPHPLPPKEREEFPETCSNSSKNHKLCVLTDSEVRFWKPSIFKILT